MSDGVFSVSDYARKWRKENFGAVFGRLCGIVIFRVMGAEFPAGYVYVSLPFCRDTVFMPLCAGKSAVAFGHVVSVFFLAFMFTQKVLLNLIIPGLFVLYWLFKGSIGGKDFLQACILPVLLFAVFAAYLYYNDALSVYWYANFPFNARIPDIFEHNRITFPPREYFEFYIFVPLGSIAAAYFVWRGNAVERMISFMFVEEALLRMFYFSAFLHYSIFWLILAMMLTVMFLDKIPVGRKVWAAAGIIYLLFSAYYNYEMTYKRNCRTTNIRTDMNMHSII